LEVLVVDEANPDDEESAKRQIVFDLFRPEPGLIEL